MILLHAHVDNGYHNNIILTPPTGALRKVCYNLGRAGALLKQDTMPTTLSFCFFADMGNLVVTVVQNFGKVRSVRRASVTPTSQRQALCRGDVPSTIMVRSGGGLVQNNGAYLGI